MDFQSVSNSITSCFQNIANTYGLVIRYDNDPRATPTSGLWCNCVINFDDSKQKEIGINSYRNTGNFTIEIYYSIGIGMSTTLKIVDIITTRFTELTISNFIKFQTPIIKNIGRVEDNYQVNVICPFFIDN